MNPRASYEYAPRSVGSTRFFIFLLHLFTKSGSFLVIMLLTINYLQYNDAPLLDRSNKRSHNVVNVTW